MKIIDLLNLIAKGEEVPEKIKFKGEEYMFYGINYTTPSEHKALHRRIELNNLNDELEIIEKEKEIEFEDIKELGNNFTFENTNSELEVRDFEKSIISKKINSLIKNQKKIIDIINDMRDKE